MNASAESVGRRRPELDIIRAPSCLSCFTAKKAKNRTEATSSES
jgi:hypothetical protein